MGDIAAIASSAAHSAFAVEVTVSRTGEDDRTEDAVLHLGMQEWHTYGGNRSLVALDAISFLSDVDIEPDDTVTCSDTSAVPSSSTWTIRDQLPDDGDRHTQTWRMVDTVSTEAI